MEIKPELIKGGIAVDDRGFLMFANDFDPVKENIRRVYIIRNINDKIVRGFHGHLNETKYVSVLKGSAKFVIAEITQVETGVPGDFGWALDGDLKEFVLSERSPAILKVPKGWANGMRSLEDDTVIIVFSDKTLEEAKNDDFRFQWDERGEDVWKIKNR